VAAQEHRNYCDLVCEGGGVKGIGLAGAFSVLEEHDFRPQNVAARLRGRSRTDEFGDDPRYRYRLQVIASDTTSHRLLVLPRDAERSAEEREHPRGREELAAHLRERGRSRPGQNHGRGQGAEAVLGDRLPGRVRPRPPRGRSPRRPEHDEVQRPRPGDLDLLRRRLTWPDHGRPRAAERPGHAGRSGS
jgi:hypothetical protein